MSRATGHFQTIRIETGRVQAAIPGLRDQQPAWMGLARTWGWVALAGIIVVGAMYFGLGPLVRRATGLVTAMIPPMQPLPAEARKQKINAQEQPK